MLRLLIHVEGQTEESFVNELLAPHLYEHGFTVVSVSWETLVSAVDVEVSVRGLPRDKTSSGIFRKMENASRRP